MTFLTPIPAIVAAGIGLGVLVALYMLKLRRRPLRVSSTALWTSAIQDMQGNIPWKWLRPGLLFLLHAAILLLIAGALGGPVWSGAGLGGTGRTILVLDASASMSARAEPGNDQREARTRLDEAKARAIELVGSLPLSGDARAMVVRSAGRAEALTAFTNSRSALREAIGSVTPSDQPGDVGALRQLLESLAAQGREEGGDSPTEPAVVLFTDGVEAGALPAVLPGTDVREVRVGRGEPESADNLGIVALAGARARDDPASVRVFVRVANNSGRERTVPVSLLLDGEGRETRGLTLPASTEAEPADASLTFELPLPAGGIVVVRLGVEDALESDDVGILAFPAPRPRRVVLVRGDGPGRHRWLLEESLGALAPESLRVIPVATWDAWSREGGTGAERPSLVVFDGCTPAGVPDASSLSFGGSLPFPGIASRLAEEPAGVPVLWWSREHPVMRPTTLDGLIVARTLEYRVEEGELPVGWSARELARTKGGLVGAVLEREGARALDDRSPRHVLVGFLLDDSNWPLLVSFAVFIGSAFDYLTLDEGEGTALTTRDPVTLTPREGAREVLASGPATARGEVPPGGREASLGTMDRAGLYRVEGANIGALGVNLLDAGESGLSAREEPLLVGRAQARATPTQAYRELWGWFVLAAGVLLLIEWLIFAWRLRA